MCFFPCCTGELNIEDFICFCFAIPKPIRHENIKLNAKQLLHNFFQGFDSCPQDLFRPLVADCVNIAGVMVEVHWFLQSCTPANPNAPFLSPPFVCRCTKSPTSFKKRRSRNVAMPLIMHVQILKLHVTRPRKNCDFGVKFRVVVVNPQMQKRRRLKSQSPLHHQLQFLLRVVRQTLALAGIFV